MCPFLGECTCSCSHLLSPALIRPESNRKRVGEREAPVFQLLNGVSTVSSNIVITAWLRDKTGQRESTPTIKDKFEWFTYGGNSISLSSA